MSDVRGFSIDFESALVWFDCPDRQCRGGVVGDMECRHCDGFGICVDISTWLSNLAIGAALCRAFFAGVDQADDFHEARAGRVSISDRIARAWFPGCGKAAP